MFLIFAEILEFNNSMVLHMLHVHVYALLLWLRPCNPRPDTSILIYIRSQADFKPNNMSLKLIIQFVVDAQLVI